MRYTFYAKNLITQKLIKNNFEIGRKGHTIKRIVLHTYGGPGRSLYNYFNNPSTDASSHYGLFFDGNGEQYVSLHNTSWHAGTDPDLPGVPVNNNYESIGIEHQDNGKPSDAVRTDALYRASAELVAKLCIRYQIPCVLLNEKTKWGKGIAKHNLYNKGKACPGGLNVKKIIKMANVIIAAQNKPTPCEAKLEQVKKELIETKDALNDATKLANERSESILSLQAELAVLKDNAVATPSETSIDTIAEAEVQASERPHNKFLERKFLVAILILPVKLIADALGLTINISETVNDLANLIATAAPIIWVVVEGKLDQEKIKQTGQATTQSLKNETQQ